MDGSRVIPPYARVKKYLKRELAKGRWKPGTQLPSESELVVRFGLSRMTVHRALRELQSEGLIERIQGLGTFACPLHRVSSALRIRDLQEEIQSRHHQHHAEVHLAREERATARVAERLDLPVGVPVFHTLIVHHENMVPLQCEDRYVNPAVAPDYLSADFTRITPTHYLLEVAPHWEAEYSIEASEPTPVEANLLKIAPSDSCLIIHRRTYSRGKRITWVRLVHPGSRYQIEGHINP